MPLFPWGLIMLPWAKFYHIKRGLSSHTDAKSQYLFKNSILMKSTPTLNLNFPAQKRNYCELDFLNKNWDFTTVCLAISFCKVHKGNFGGGIIKVPLEKLLFSGRILAIFTLFNLVISEYVKYLTIATEEESKVDPFFFSFWNFLHWIWSLFRKGKKSLLLLLLPQVLGSVCILSICIGI